MGDRVHGATVRVRALRVRDVSRSLHEAFVASQVGTRHVALTLEDGTLALTGNYLKLRVPPRHPRNTWVSVTVESPGTGSFPSDNPS